MRKITVTGRAITAVMCVELTEEMVLAIKRRPTQLNGLLKDLHATGAVCQDKEQNFVFEMSLPISNVFILQGEMAHFEKIEHQFTKEVSKWVEEDAAKEEEVSKTMKRIWEEAHKEAHKKAMKDKPEDASEVYVHLKRTDRGYEVEGNMSLEEVVQTLASTLISYAANKK